ncbi:MAG: T9SS type A sorting domain-containing protein [Bacteroidota bacterium]
MKKLNLTKPFIALLATVLLWSGSAHAEANLSFVKTTPNTVSVNLQNSTPVAGLQFTVHGSANLVLESIRKSERTHDGNWQIHQHRVNDSTINVVILNINAVNFQAGNGAIAEFSFRENAYQPSFVSRLSFSRVVIADQYAQGIAYTLAGLEWSSPVALADDLPFTLQQNYPNPFNPSTTIRYKLEQPGHVRLSIFDITGREVMRVLDQHQLGGTYSATWTGQDEAGRQVASGVYVAQLNVNGALATMRMTFAK